MKNKKITYAIIAGLGCFMVQIIPWMPALFLVLALGWNPETKVIFGCILLINIASSSFLSYGIFRNSKKLITIAVIIASIIVISSVILVCLSVFKNY